MENKNGSGIFLGVVGVATLVVAIVGATFAWFSASAGKADISASSYQFATSSNTTKVDDNQDATVQGLIPLNTGDVSAAVKAATPCVDKKGYDACEIWKVEFTNNAASAVTLKATAQTTSNTFTTGNLKLTLGHATLDEVTGTGAVSLDGTADTLNTVPVDAATINGETGEVTSAGKATMYYVVYLENQSGEQNADQKQSMTGTITFEDQNGNAIQADFGA